MTVFVIRRLLQALLVVFLMSVIVFFGVNIVGDPVYMLVSPDADQADIAATIERLGLDRPIIEQYWLFLKGAAQGNLGNSFIFGEPALKLILHHMPATMELAFTALMLAVVIGIPLGLYAGLYPENPVSKGIMATSILGVPATRILGRSVADYALCRRAGLAAVHRTRRYGDLPRY